MFSIAKPLLVSDSIWYAEENVDGGDTWVMLPSLLQYLDAILACLRVFMGYSKYNITIYAARFKINLCCQSLKA